jgi:hypothetical protein
MEEFIMNEQVLNVVENAADVVEKQGLLTKENGIKALAVIGAATVVYGGYKVLMFGINKVRKPKATETVKETTQTTETKQTTEEVVEEVKVESK